MSPVPMLGRMLIHLILCCSYEGHHNFCEFVRTVVLSCPEDTVSSWSSPPSSAIVSEPIKEGGML